jgi:PD-(D/E)XK nuclease superfamily protein
LRSISSCDAEDSPHRIQRSCFDEPLRFDLLVDDCLLAELKAVELLHPSSKAQLFSYMKLLDIPLGLLINFHEPILKNGILRMILPGANQREGGDDNKVSLWDPYPGTLLSSLTSVEVLCGGFHVTGKWRKTKG